MRWEEFYERIMSVADESERRDILDKNTFTLAHAAKAVNKSKETIRKHLVTGEIVGNLIGDASYGCWIVEPFSLMMFANKKGWLKEGA